MGTPVAIAGLWWAALAAGNPAYDLAGRIHPPMPASVSLHGATSPFSASTLSDAGGRFQFHRLLAGTYTVIVFVPGRGEMRRTIEVGPSLADKRGRVEIAVEFASGDPASGALVSARELAVPERAWQEYRRAGQKLERRDVAGAIAHLERALEIAPHFVAAWNHLGTLAYQTRQYPKAETYFRQALKHDPRAFEPLVNLGGVLLTLGKLEEALQYNLYSVLSRPNDALANSQLGMTYFAVGSLELAHKYLEIAKRLDPAHFSHPQLTLAEIHLRSGKPEAALAEFEDFLQRHPDSPDAPRIRALVAKLRTP